MSIYSSCSKAISDLSELHEVFTEIDVVNHAAEDGWSKANYKEAKKYANQIISAKYRSGEVVRYGPVEYDGITDYARKATMIVYGGVENGPEFWETPNGKMPRLPKHEDTFQISGRRKGTARHDELPWAEQDVPADIKIARQVTSGATKSNGRKGGTSDQTQQEIQRLNIALSESASRVAELERLLANRDTEIASLKNGGATASSEAPGGDVRHQVETIVLELIAEYEERLTDVEGRVKRFTAALAG
jgi:hypothetical protein